MYILYKPSSLLTLTVPCVDSTPCYTRRLDALCCDAVSGDMLCWYYPKFWSLSVILLVSLLYSLLFPLSFFILQFAPSLLCHVSTVLHVCNNHPCKTQWAVYSYMDWTKLWRKEFAWIIFNNSCKSYLRNHFRPNHVLLPMTSLCPTST